VYDVGLFKGLSEDFIRGVVMGLKSHACLAQDYIYREGHYGIDMIFLRTGGVHLMVDVAGVTSLLDTVTEGGHFGDISWFLQINRTETAMATTNCEYYTLDYTTFDMAATHHPEYKEMIQHKVKQKLQDDVDDWEDAVNGFSDIYSDEKRDQLSEKLKIAKHMLRLCKDKHRKDIPDDGKRGQPAGAGARRNSRRKLQTLRPADLLMLQNHHNADQKDNEVPHVSKAPAGTTAETNERGKETAALRGAAVVPEPDAQQIIGMVMENRAMLEELAKADIKVLAACWKRVQERNQQLNGCRRRLSSGLSADSAVHDSRRRLSSDSATCDSTRLSSDRSFVGR
jgi:CRP-like cAMP-binding protein